MENLLEPVYDDEDDDVIVFPPEVMQAVEEKNRKSLVVKLLNPKYQKSPQISFALPKAWRLTGSVRSMTLAYNSKVKFTFESESDILSVLNQEPWSFNDWMLVIDRFTEYESPNFLRFMNFWVEIIGIPWNYKHPDVIKEIGSLLGEVLDVKYIGTSVRAKIRIDVNQGLEFVRPVEFGSHAEAVQIRFVYKNLKMFCQNCGSLTHHKSSCPLPRPNQV